MSEKQGPNLTFLFNTVFMRNEDIFPLMLSCSSLAPMFLYLQIEKCDHNTPLWPWESMNLLNRGDRTTGRTCSTLMGVSIPCCAGQ